jgi:hypothetical protein
MEEKDLRSTPERLSDNENEKIAATSKEMDSIRPAHSTGGSLKVWNFTCVKHGGVTPTPACPLCLEEPQTEDWEKEYDRMDSLDDEEGGWVFPFEGVNSMKIKAFIRSLLSKTRREVRFEERERIVKIAEGMNLGDNLDEDLEKTMDIDSYNQALSDLSSRLLEDKNFEARE